MINCVRSFRFCSVYTVIIRCLVYRILSCCHCFINFSFCCCLLFICRIRRLIDFRFLALAAFSIAVLLVFLNNRWLDIVNRIYTVCFRSVYTCIICCLVYRILSCCHCFIDFRFCCFFFVCRVWCLVDFRFLSFRRFINRCFASSFLTTVGWILLIESKPFDFAVSTPSLFVTWSIDAFALFTASSTFAFAAAFSSSVASGV